MLQLTGCLSLFCVQSSPAAAQLPQLLLPVQYVVSRRGLPESEARWFFQQLMLGMDYCHRKGGSSSAGPLLVTVD